MLFRSAPKASPSSLLPESTFQESFHNFSSPQRGGQSSARFCSALSPPSMLNYSLCLWHTLSHSHAYIENFYSLCQEAPESPLLLLLANSSSPFKDQLHGFLLQAPSLSPLDPQQPSLPPPIRTQHLTPPPLEHLLPALSLSLHCNCRPTIQ